MSATLMLIKSVNTTMINTKNNKKINTWTYIIINNNGLYLIKVLSFLFSYPANNYINIQNKNILCVIRIRWI